MPNLVPDILPILVLAVGFAAGFYYRHKLSLRRQRNRRRHF